MASFRASQKAEQVSIRLGEHTVSRVEHSRSQRLVALLGNDLQYGLLCALQVFQSLRRHSI